MDGVAVLAVFAAFGGALALLAGVYGLRQVRRVQRTGVCVLALVMQAPGRGAEEPVRPRPLLQFVTDDERVMEVVCPVASTSRRPLADGDRVLLHYDPADPRSVVVRNRERLGMERAFIAAGGTVLLLALGLLAVVAL
ncbi:DUF3592 domain-containing protein [Streptomyces sp. NPDC056149]|uniref:DUF3592 domain-containing protein n=1 Tax=unclassified Streptomyces TaxID=2593676 RepID=UPI00238170E4|nr:DUF3592 domain-containing protein [Streptomyces sp. WZ-12]